MRTRTSGVWSGWQTVPYDPEHGPDPGSAEARHARPGTEPVLVGQVDDVQVRASTVRPLPPDLRLAVISPGHATATASERAAIDTSAMDGGTGADSVYAAAAAEQLPDPRRPGQRRPGPMRPIRRPSPRRPSRRSR